MYVLKIFIEQETISQSVCLSRQMSSKGQSEQKAAVKTWTLDAIMTFREAGQKFYTMNGIAGTVTESELLYGFFSILDDSEVADLIKFSFCQMDATLDDLIPALRPNGKFYFNTDVNKDKNTKRHADIKRKYLQDKKKVG